MICEEIFVVGIDWIEVLLNLLEFFDSIVWIVDVMGDCVLIGVGMVLFVVDVDKVNVVGGCLVVLFDCNFEVIVYIKVFGL